MRKSNWIIIGILAIASFVFLGMWYFLDFNAADSPFDLVLSIAWWALIIALCIVIHVLEKRRQESLRTTFLAPGIVYNREIGIVKLDNNDSVISVMQNILSELEYGFELDDTPDSAPIRFKQIVRTTKFKENGRIWEGEVIDVNKPGQATPFHSMEELSTLI